MQTRKNILCLFFCCLSTFLIGQNQKNADKAYEKKAYKKAIQFYEQKEEKNMEDLDRIATGYRLNHDTQKAELWYSQLIDVSDDPMHLFYYAQALQSNGKTEKAKNYFLRYHGRVGSMRNDDRGKYLAAAIDRMNTLEKNEVEIKNETTINSDKLDYSPTFYKNGIAFVSSRKISDDQKGKIDGWMNDHFMNLFYVNKKMDGTLGEVAEFSTYLNSSYHEGPASFSKSGDQIFFTRNDFKKGKKRINKKGIMKLEIFTSVREGEDWSEPHAANFNTKEYDECHPTLNATGDKLFFASDRAGGRGGMDLYMVEFKMGNWSEPINLGPEVNTPGNEIFPFIHDSGTLYFSSDGWGGIGGLDIFSTTLDMDDNWNEPKNIGAPINSLKDDFGFILNILETEGYFSSAREGGNGKDDIYSFRMPQNTIAKKKEVPCKVTICAYEMGTENQISDVQFTLVEKGRDNTTASMDADMAMLLEETKKKNEYILKFKKSKESSAVEATSIFNTDEKGEFETTFKHDRMYSIVVTKDGYQIAEEEFDGQQLEGIESYRFCIPLKKMDCMSLDGIVKNGKYGNLIPGATVTMTSLCTGDDIVVKADANGAFSFSCIPCECDFVLKGEKSNLRSGASKENTMGNNCKLGTTISTELLLSPDDEKIAALFEGTELKAGAVVELKNIYYDFDQYYIRKDAQDDLDNVIQLMHQYPNMVVELSSHTDARATDKYNETLSQNRANAAVEYIISRGINRNRLVPMGYGERMLRNPCANFVDCTEEEHQNNRRTEIKVLRFDQKDIKVKEIDNAPETIDPADPKRRFRWN